jgi:AraC-like DNA-binding protein
MEMMFRNKGMTAGLNRAETMRAPTMGASTASALMELAVSKGASRKILAERSGIDREDLADRANRIPFDKYVRLMRAGQELLADPALALHFGESVDASETSLGCVLGAVDTIDDAFAQVNRYARLSVEVDCVGSGDRFQLTRALGWLWIVDARRSPNAFPELTESTFARMVCSTRRGLGETRLFKGIEFTHAAPAYRAEYDRIFRMPVVFESERNALQIDASLLSNYRMPPSSGYVSAVLKEHAETLLAKLDRSQSTRDRVVGLLTPLLATGGVSVDIIAAKLGLSRQTLFRKLKVEGVTFQQVLDELRHQLALHYLSANKPVSQTARLVGYSDPAAFSRAFKRWTGSSPRERGRRD